MPLKKAPIGKILNPKTGRYVSTSGELGKSLKKKVTFKENEKPKSPKKIYNKLNV